MAPYHMLVTIQNNTSYRLGFGAWARLSSLDGESQALSGRTWEPGLVQPKSTMMATDFVKSGGTDGLFSGQFWNIAGSKMRLFHYVRMPASAGGSISHVVGVLGDNNTSTIESYIQRAQDEAWNTQEYSVAGTVKGEAILIKIAIVATNNDYPNASVTIEVNAYATI